MKGELSFKGRILRTLAIGGLALLLVMAFLKGNGTAQGQVPATSPEIGRVPSLVTPSSELTATIYLPYVARTSALTTTIYLPYVARRYPMLTVFGAGMDQLTFGGGLDQMVAAKASWTRPMGVLWSSVESTEGTYNWSGLASLESELQNASSKGIRVILIVQSTPQWARKIAGSGPYCGPIHPDKLATFGSFMGELVARYSVPPYNVKYWEVWNEPDIDPLLVSPESGWGCWGDATDDYYGGGYYGNMLKEVYPAIKAADPSAQVLVGGLLLDCDPANSICRDGREKPALFLEGILHHNGQNDGGQYFDGVSFHGYDHYQGSMGRYYNPNWQSTWNTTGPVGLAKARFLEGVLSAHGVTGKFLMNTESAILCPSCNSDAAFEATKAYYVAQAYAAAIAEGWRANIWYSVLGWRNSGLLNPDLSPKPAYEAFRVSRSELQDARVIREIVEYAGVKGYVFDRGDRQVWLMWSLDGTDNAVTLPFTPTAVLDVFGNPLGASSMMTVTLRPVYVER